MISAMLHKCPPLAVVAALALASPFAAAQAPVVTFTSPSGYVKHTFDPGFNLVAIGLHERAVFKGAIDAESGAEITDSDASFDTILTDTNATYLLEVTTGGQLGAVAEIISWTATTVTLDGAITAGVNESYCIRPAKTLDSVFSDNLTGADFDASAADKIWIAQPGGSYVQYFYSTAFGEFRRTDDPFTDPGKPVAIFYPDALFVEIASSQKMITLFGDVKVVPTIVAANQGFNLVRVSSPAGQTLAESKLELFLKQVPGFDANLGDKIWLPDGAGGWIQYAYFGSTTNTPPAWKLANNPFGPDAGGTELPSAILIERLSTEPNTAGIFDLPDAFDNY